MFIHGTQIPSCCFYIMWYANAYNDCISSTSILSYFLVTFTAWSSKKGLNNLLDIYIRVHHLCTYLLLLYKTFCGAPFINFTSQKILKARIFSVSFSERGAFTLSVSATGDLRIIWETILKKISKQCVLDHLSFHVKFVSIYLRSKWKSKYQ